MFANHYLSFPAPGQTSFASGDAEHMGWSRDLLGDVELAPDASRALQEPPQVLFNQVEPTTRFVAPVGNWQIQSPHISLPTLTVAPSNASVPDSSSNQNFFTPMLTVSPAGFLVLDFHVGNQNIHQPTITISPAQLLSCNLSHAPNPSVAPASNFSSPSSYPAGPTYTPCPMTMTTAPQPLLPSSDSSSNYQKPVPTLLSIGSPAASETSSGSSSNASTSEASTSFSPSTSRYNPDFYPINRFTMQGQQSGVLCTRLFKCKWGSCTAQIELKGLSDTQQMEFHENVQNHIKEHAAPCEVNGERVCYWDGLSEARCTTLGKFTKPRTMERHIKTHLQDWRVFCQGCDFTLSRASQLPPHHRKCRQYQAKRVAGKLTTPTTRKRKAAARTRGFRAVEAL